MGGSLLEVIGFKPENPGTDVFFFPHGLLGAIMAEATYRVELCMVIASLGLEISDC